LSDAHQDVNIEDILRIELDDEKKSILLSSRVTKLDELSSIVDDKSGRSDALSFTVPDVNE
jgi:hypothetical protein